MNAEEFISKTQEGRHDTGADPSGFSYSHSLVVKLLDNYAAHCEESAWVDVNDSLPERWDGYPLSRNCFLFNGKEYLMGFYSYAHSQWESDEYAPIEGVTHWRPLPKNPGK